MSKLYGVDPIKQRQSARVAVHVQDYLAKGGTITQCPAGKETWQLYCTEAANGELIVKRCKVLPDLLQMRKKSTMSVPTLKIQEEHQ